MKKNINIHLYIKMILDDIKYNVHFQFIYNVNEMYKIYTIQTKVYWEI